MADPDRTKFLAEAMRLAAESVDAGGGPFGAVVVRDGRIVSRARNRVTETNDPTAHAEILAIREACRALGSFQLSDCDIYCSGEPCPMCLGAIYWARPRAVYFARDREEAAAAGFDDSLIYEEMRRAPERRRLPMRRLLVESAVDAYRKWTEKDDRVEY